MEELTESHRFDSELAALLTRFQYHKDDITLTAAEPRPLPSSAYTASTAGLEAVFDSSASLVFVCYDDRTHQMVNPIEVTLSHAIATAVRQPTEIRPDGGTADFRNWSADGTGRTDPAAQMDITQTVAAQQDPPSFGVVTPHNAQRGALETQFPEAITANTVEKYQGGERDIIAVSATVSDPEFARREEQFILNPNRLLVAISRSRLLTVVVCSTSLFEVAPKESDRLANGPVWARLFTQTAGTDPTPAWSGSLAAFTGNSGSSHASVPVRVYPSTDPGGM
ncbi:hypothetical protein DP106_13905 [Halonotius pteroides]|uniref:DNA2/NAM7 helicase-like C-terminal domain-containing protein n=2 Tax=Halonotius pteroides TaxID=268735 RepID=A0A3A6Q851_9EURY|nr:hypothetical protein DP106_13905 [Halonotius pteroides]